ncbi:MAG: hypothetical protein Q8K99_08625 [Actinomycetota bacterium]|nr:hypothetical protein [Actinomycetota bacterium]
MSLSSPRRRRLTVAAYALVGVLALVLVVLVSVGIGGATGAGCSWCHREPAQVTEESSSAHAAVACARCHSYGATGRVSLGVHGISASVPGVGSSAVGPVRQGACLDCHKDVLTRVSEGNGLRMDHRTCVGPHESCAGCHGGSLHEALGGPPRVVTMDECLVCHVSINRTEGCSLCHVGRREDAGLPTPWKVTHGMEWEKTHGAGDLSTCRYCHFESDSCTGCHVDMPHPDRWPSLHGKGVDKARATCTPCHQNAFCDSCHGMDMPHPADWLPTHPKHTDGYEDPLCTRCHLREDCTACHVAHTHPGNIRGKEGAR